jgi:hypothetical protein
LHISIGLTVQKAILSTVLENPAVGEISRNTASADFFENTRLPEKGPSGTPIATFIGEYHRRKNENVAKSGHLKDLLSYVAADT